MAVQAPLQRFGLLIKDKHTSLPLKDVSVDAEIQGYVLGLKSTLKYVSDSTDPVEVMFRFPLEQSHAVVGLTAVIDGRRIKAQIKEKEQARADYDDAIASGQSAALGEEKSGDVFSISLGNLAPGKEAEINLQLVGELPIDAEGNVRFSLPSTLKPRYTPAGWTDPLASVESSGGEAQVEHAKAKSVQGFRLSLRNGKSVDEVTSPTHKISEQTDSTTDILIVTLAESESSTTDLVILVKYKEPHSPKVLVDKGSDTNKFMSSTAVMVDFFPDFEHVEAACEFIFLVDRSGSMSGSYIKSARETLMLFLKSLPEGCYFNIIGFGSTFRKLFKETSVAYNDKTLNQATEHAQSMDANLGGTELFAPLDQIFREKPTSGLPRQVFVLTDGAVSNTNACIRKVKENALNSRCFTFGIGSGASTALVEGLARAGNGTAEFVKEGERMQPKVIRSLKRALQPAVTEVSVEFKIPKSSDFEIKQSPHTLPPVYKNEKMVVYGIITPKSTPKDHDIKGTALLKGLILGKPMSHSVEFKFNPVSKELPLSLPTIHHLAAKALIKDWESERASKEEIVKLSVESSVISSHTAFIAVDDGAVEPVSGAMKTWDVKASNAPTQGTPAARTQQQQQQVDDVQRIMSANIDRVLARSDALDDLKEKSEDLALNAHVFSKSSSKAKKGFSFGGFFSGFFGSKSSTNRSSSTVGSRQLDSDSPMEGDGLMYDNDDSLCSSASDDENELEMLEEEECEGESLNLQSKEKSSPSPHMRRAKPANETVTLSSLIAMQTAGGSWKLDDRLLKHFGKTLKEIEDACPTDCKGDVTTFWATVLVLSLLRKKYASQQDEWELVGMKAESWVKKQTIPSGVALQNFYTAAEKLL